ncbi:MAG TPA: hypothetical protein VMH22_06505 [bacterium]|nr:hypothetical protein [bacterium]
MRSAISRLSPQTADILEDRFRHTGSCEQANEILERLTGIVDFFANQSEYEQCVELLLRRDSVAAEHDRREYGDFQTPLPLADAICVGLTRERVAPHVLIEPTFGRGSFLLSALQRFSALRDVHGVEIHEPYCWQTKFALVELFSARPSLHRPRIHLHRADVFKFDFAAIADTLGVQDSVLVLGNPPWVTNSELGSIGSRNLPRKSNLKSLKGLDAITGRGNFDIGEYIILEMLDAFSRQKGWLAMLAKNAVIRNVVYDLPRTRYPLSELSSRRIDAQSHFGASVEASLFTCRLRADAQSPICRVSSLGCPDETDRTFGWLDGRFVADAVGYQKCRRYDGASPFVWRQGIKHDCSRIMELRAHKGRYVNGLGTELDVEPDLVFGLLKSSDLSTPIAAKPERFLIVTQMRIGEDTGHLAKDYPKLHGYLSANATAFSQRKSSIYRDKPPFSIFGVGDYSFKPYKVAISGLYRRSGFTLVLPCDGRPTMLDDTCYFIGFSRKSDAVFAWLLLNSEPVQRLLRSLVFLDAKRPYTKDVLMRIALDRVVADTTLPAILRQASHFATGLLPRLSEDDWQSFRAVVEANGRTESARDLFDSASVNAGA